MCSLVEAAPLFAVQGVRRVGAASGGRLHHAPAGQRKHQRARYHDRREGLRPHQTVLERAAVAQRTANGADSQWQGTAGRIG